MLLLVGIAFAAAQPSTPIVVDTSVCALMARPAGSNGKMARIRATYATDFTHSSLLIDSDCRGGIDPYGNELSPEQSAVLRRAVGSELEGYAWIRFTATFIGRFEWVPQDDGSAWYNPFRFVLTEVSDIEIADRNRDR